VPHLSYHFNEPGNEVWILNVFVGFIKDNKLIERVTLVRCLRKDLQQDDKETKRFVLLDECITQINDFSTVHIFSTK